MTKEKFSKEFFVAMIPPTITDQEHRVGVRNGKPFFYDHAELKEAKQKLEAHFARFAPGRPLQGPVMLIVKWCFPCPKSQHPGYKFTKPDGGNLNKALDDVMTKLGFWEDDAQIASETVEKFWVDDKFGIYVKVSEL